MFISKMIQTRILMSKVLFSIFITILSLNLYGQPNYPTDPSKATLVYTDIEHFLEAYKQLRPGVDTVSILQEYYFERGSAGLKEYINRHGLTAEMLQKAITESPEEYNSIPSFLAAKESFTQKYLAILEDYKKVIPSAMFPPTYLLVGANRGIAQASRVGQLVSIVRNINKDHHQDRRLTTMIHELTHFQQARTLGFQQYSQTYTKENNMLDLILREGGAEWVAYKLVRKNTKDYDRLKYVNKHLKSLRKRFKADLDKQDSTYWLWESINQSETPILLGYTMGYKICDAYYKRAKDKKQAVEDILGIDKPELFLEKSGFLGKK